MTSYSDSPNALIDDVAKARYVAHHGDLLYPEFKFGDMIFVDKDKAVDLLGRVLMSAAMLKAWRLSISTDPGQRRLDTYLTSIIVLLERGEDGWDDLGEQLRNQNNEQ